MKKHILERVCSVDYDFIFRNPDLILGLYPEDLDYATFYYTYEDLLEMASMLIESETDLQEFYADLMEKIDI